MSSLQELSAELGKAMNICMDKIIPKIPTNEISESVEDDNERMIDLQLHRYLEEDQEQPSQAIELQMHNYFQIAKQLQIKLERIVYHERNKDERALKDEIACLEQEVERKREVITKYTTLMQKWSREFIKLDEECDTPLPKFE
ncbi:1257_t:CDS:2 [Ambispora leptoticha]|uniref:1257_t:CDS:1 n=1 Tax=Ambispora leptoticha TaxID=144679 RepID=A0A9N9FSE8_9GLOM|nr:1257_t:CDS:2 [Ambispora leptoticha]